MLTGTNQPKMYTPTVGTEIHTLQFITPTGGNVFAEVWDTAGNEKYGGLRDAYYLYADAVIYFVEGNKSEKDWRKTDSGLGLSEIVRWKREVERVVPDIPFQVVDRTTAETFPTFAFRRVLGKLGVTI